MSRWLLDTNVISEIRRSRPSREVTGWISAIPLENLFTSTVNIAELRFGISSQTSAADAHTLTIWLEAVVRPWFAKRIVDVGETVLFRWRVLVRELERKRLLAPAVDLLIAAVALEHGLKVATRDTEPFVGTRVPVLNPWTGERFNGA